MDEDLKEYLTNKGAYNEQIVLNTREHIDILHKDLKSKHVLHVFEYRQHIDLDFEDGAEFNFKQNWLQNFNIDEGSYITQKSENLEEQEYFNVFFAFKDQNFGKLHTHFMLFKGFCPLLNPEFIITIDVGTKPLKEAIWKMLSFMDTNPKSGIFLSYFFY